MKTGTTKLGRRAPRSVLHAERRAVEAGAISCCQGQEETVEKGPGASEQSGGSHQKLSADAGAAHIFS